VRLALLHRVVNQERLEEIAGDVADAVTRDVVDEELDLLKVKESATVVLRDGTEEIENFLGCGFADAAAFAGVRVSETDFVTFAEGG